MSRRIDRINEQLRDELSTVLARQIKDPRLDGVISITRVESSSDLRSARVYISVLGNQEQQKEALDGLQSAASFLRREMRNRINMKHTPFMTYLLDESIQDADHILRLINADRPADSFEQNAKNGISELTTDSVALNISCSDYHGEA